MAENRHRLNPVRRRRRRLTDDGKDRLSSLPDAILTEILSRLPINTAASTSVLSHHWRHLWTGVSRFELYNVKTPNLTHFLGGILPHLTSPKIDVFKIEVSKTTYSPKPDAVESCFQDVCRRNVQQFFGKFGNFFPIPTCLLKCQSLVILELFGSLEFEYDWHKNKAVQLQLPNLRTLCFNYLVQVPAWLGSLNESSPLLEDLTLIFNLVDPDDAMPVLNLYLSNLKILKLEVSGWNLTAGLNLMIFIDAPKLTHLEIDHSYGCTLPYTFCCNPTALVKARIDLIRNDEDEDEFGFNEEELYRFSKFFGGMSSIRHLELSGERNFNMFTNLCVNVNPPIFFNLVTLKVTLFNFDLSDCKELLVLLQCYPNLELLSVNLYSGDFCKIIEQRNWLAPDNVPSCLTSKLKKIMVIGQRCTCVLNLLSYILGNAKVLEKLYLFTWFEKDAKEEQEREFCRSLFKLPRSSSICDVTFSGKFIIKSTRYTIDKRMLTFQMA